MYFLSLYNPVIDISTYFGIRFNVSPLLLLLEWNETIYFQLKCYYFQYDRRIFKKKIDKRFQYEIDICTNETN